LNKQTSNIHDNCQPVVKWFCLHKTRENSRSISKSKQTWLRV